jgi:V/A-type H+/Na+-transporting ATPase subunit E
METQLQDIIDKIHDEGVKGAEERARKIVESAEKQAGERIEQARREAEGIIKSARDEAAKHQASGEAALKQASRDLLLSVRTELTRLFEAVQRDQIGAALSPEKAAPIIAGLIEQWNTAGTDDIEVMVSEKDRDALEQSLQAALSRKLSEGVEIRPVRGITAGFRIGSKDGSSYYDVTDATLAELLSAYLNPRLGEIMRNAVGQ